MIDPDLLEKAARICDAASVSAEASAVHYGRTAQQLGLAVVMDEDDNAIGGADLEAVELASKAWIAVDLSIGARDPRRDAEAARILRAGWMPSGDSARDILNAKEFS